MAAAIDPDKSISWDDVIKKEARGAVDDSDFGEVQEVAQHYVLTQKGTISKKKFYIPKYLVQGYDGDTLWFNASDRDLEGWEKEYAPGYNEYTQYQREAITLQPQGSPSITPSEAETKIPLIEERLKVTKTTSTSEVTVTKKPVTETQNVQVPVTHEELVVETRPASEATTTSDRPVQSDTDTKVSLSEEHVHVTKEPYVKEEAVIKKKAVTETETVSDTVTGEELYVSDKKED
jgi:uncharacterized protein (TIGR02271 family)